MKLEEDGHRVRRDLKARDGVEAMDRKRVRIQKPKSRHERSWTEVLPLDPRDPDVLRAKLQAYRSSGTSQLDQADLH
jgi:hypothetical protein